MKIGVFGGTFDPPHIGHLILAADAKAQLDLDKILWVLTTFPPHKKEIKITPIESRKQMVELAIKGNHGFALSTVDINREPPHYAVDTVLILKSQAPRDEFYYLMGLDSLNDLPSWHKPSEFVNICDGIVVMMRKGEELRIASLSTILPGLEDKLYLLKTPLIDISASDIRIRIQDGAQFRYFVPEAVYKYILQNNLYQA